VIQAFQDNVLAFELLVTSSRKAETKELSFHYKLNLLIVKWYSFVDLKSFCYVKVSLDPAAVDCSYLAPQRRTDPLQRHNIAT
jgi:hypothetical protein